MVTACLLFRLQASGLAVAVKTISRAGVCPVAPLQSLGLMLMLVLVHVLMHMLVLVHTQLHTWCVPFSQVLFLQWQYCCHTHAHGHASVSSCSCRSAAETSVLVCRSCKAAALQVPDAQYIMLCFCLCLCRCLCLCALPAHSCALIAAGRQVAQFV